MHRAAPKVKSMPKSKSSVPSKSAARRAKHAGASAPRKPIGMLTRSDLLAAHRRRLDETHVTEQSLSWWPRG